MPLCLREVRPEDSALLFDWRNDPETRRNSIHTDEVTLEEHEKWFDSISSGLPGQVKIAEVDGVAVGVVRVDWSQEHSSYNISFTVAPEHRGKGLGTQIIQNRLQSLGNARVLADTRLSNTASRRIFERLGFEVVETHGEFLLYAKDLSTSAP